MLFSSLPFRSCRRAHGHLKGHGENSAADASCAAATRLCRSFVRRVSKASPCKLHRLGLLCAAGLKKTSKQWSGLGARTNAHAAMPQMDKHPPQKLAPTTSERSHPSGGWAAAHKHIKQLEHEPYSGGGRRWRCAGVTVRAA